MKFPRFFKYCCYFSVWFILFVNVLLLFFGYLVLFINDYTPKLVEVDSDDQSLMCNDVSDIITAKIEYWNFLEWMIFAAIMLFLVTCVAPCFLCRNPRRYLKKKLVFIDWPTSSVSEIKKVPQSVSTPPRALGGLATILVVLLIIIAIPYFVTSYELSKTMTTANADESGGTIAGYLKFSFWVPYEQQCSHVEVDCKGDLTFDCSEETGFVSGGCYTDVYESATSNVVLAIFIPMEPWLHADWAVESYICGNCHNPDCCYSTTSEPISELKVLQDQVLCNLDYMPGQYTISLTPEAVCKSTSSGPGFSSTKIDKTTFSMEISQQTSAESNVTLLFVVPPVSSNSNCYIEVSSSSDLMFQIISFIGSMLGIRTIVRQIFTVCWDSSKKCRHYGEAVPLQQIDEEQELLTSNREEE